MKNSNKLIFFALAAAMTLALFTGCAGGEQGQQKNQKADAQVQEQVKTASEKASTEADTFPKHVRKTFTSEVDTAVIDINAVVEVQSVAMPSVRVCPRSFTQEDAANIIAILSEDGKLYADSKDTPSAERIAAKLQSDKALLEAIQTHPEQFSTNARLITSGAFEKSVEVLEAAIETAAPLGEFDEAFKKEEQNGDEIGDISGGFIRDGQYYALIIGNDETGGSLICSRLQNDPVALRLMQPYTLTYQEQGADIVGVVYSEALSLAEGIVSGISAGEMVLGSAVGIAYPEEILPGYYQFYFVRQVNGASVGVDNTQLAEDVYNASVADASFVEGWPYESLQVRVDAKGLLHLQWVSPMTVVETLTERTALLPFEEILSCFGKLAFVKGEYREQLGWQNDSGKIISRVRTNIERIQLSLMRVESEGGFFLIPVWDFYGYTDLLDQDDNPFSFATTQPNSEYTEYGKKGESEFTSIMNKTQAEVDLNRIVERQTSLLTINAIDGTIIDRLTGY